MFNQCSINVQSMFNQPFLFQTLSNRIKFLYITVLNIISDSPEVTLIVMWLYYRGDHKARFILANRSRACSMVFG